MIKGVDYIAQGCAYLKFKAKEKYTASTFFRRFFLKNSLLEFDYHSIAVVCMFLAAKVEEKQIKLIQFLEILGSHDPSLKEFSAEKMQSIEVKIVNSLNFHFMVHSALEPLRNYLNVVQRRI